MGRICSRALAQALLVFLKETSGPPAGHAMCYIYRSLCINPAHRTIEDYFALFRAHAIGDCLLVLQLISSSFVYFLFGTDVLLKILVVCVFLIWLCDGVLMLLFSSRVREACGGNPDLMMLFSSRVREGCHGNPAAISQDQMDGLIRRKQILVAVCLLNLIAYVALFCVQLSVISKLGKPKSEKVLLVLDVLAVALIKVCRLVSLNSFSTWIRSPPSPGLTASESAPSA